jgi:hypothetical protein
LNQEEALKERVDKVANVNEFNRREDEEVDRQIQNAGDNPSPVRAPWLRKRNEWQRIIPPSRKTNYPKRADKSF